MDTPFACNSCSGELEKREDSLVCKSCGKHAAILEGDLAIFDDAVDKFDFFEEKVASELEKKYADYGRDDFLKALELRDFWEMDDQNKHVGVARKFWWEDHIGKVENKHVLEIGCGVNYFPPYWLESGNQLVAFDMCKSSVLLARKLCEKSGVAVENATFGCADATTIQFSRKFDVINVNNVLHHVEDRVAAFQRMGESLAENGKLLLVEPNFYYPPRWIVETDAFDPFNPAKNYFMKNQLLEKDEKGIVFSTFKNELKQAGFRIIANDKDLNYAGYFSIYWMKSGSPLAKAIHYLDRGILRWIMPRVLAPFEYIIAEKI